MCMQPALSNRVLYGRPCCVVCTVLVGTLGACTCVLGRYGTSNRVLYGRPCCVVCTVLVGTLPVHVY